MAIYTPPRTPASYPNNAMNSTLHTDYIPSSSWSTWRPSKPQTPLTPPHSAHTQRRLPPPPAVYQPQPALPSIAQFDRQLTHIPPSSSNISSVPQSSESHLVHLVTPPQEEVVHWYGHPPQKQPVSVIQEPQGPCDPLPEEMDDDDESLSPIAPTHRVSDWFSPSLRSSQYIAEKTCEMVCYLWFSTLCQTSSSAKRSRLLEQRSSLIPEHSPETATLQYAVAPAFITFMQKLLETTQVSQSVIVLSLHYIYRLKLRNRYTNGAAGSEYRVATAAIMLANKFVDDNTYTNKTWSEVSCIDLVDINRMEREFLLGIDFDLYVDKTTYESWLNLLTGLVMAKERDSKQWRRSRYGGRIPLKSRTGPVRQSRGTARHHNSTRARSSSPARSAAPYPFSSPPKYASPPVQRVSEYATPSRSGAKRSASDAFSPTSDSFPGARPSKRSMGLTLEIPELVQTTTPSTSSSESPLENLQSLARLTLHNSPAVQRDSPNVIDYPRTLAAAYRRDEQRTYSIPDQLYFYSLAGSPAEPDNGNRPRKGRLHYYQPPQPSLPPPPQPSVPMMVQSARASPHDFHTHLPPATSLPHFSDGVWDRRQGQAPVTHAHTQHLSLPSPGHTVPAATFANAGPPGVQFYSNNCQPGYSPEHYWARDRRL